MTETWVKKAKSDALKLGRWASKWTRIFPAPVWMVILVAGLVGGRLLYLKLSRPAHLSEISAAWGAVNILNNPAQFNHDFSRFTYVTFTDTRGVGVFLCSTISGEKRLIDVQTNGPGPWHDDWDLRVWPWSPDDTAFIYSMSGTIGVGSLDTNIPIVRFPLTNTVSEVAWLSSSEFAWLENGYLAHATKPFRQEWTVQKLPLAGKATGLKAIDAHTVAWAQNSYICRVDFSATSNSSLAQARTITEPPTNHLILWLDASTLTLANREPVNFLSDRSPSRNTAFNNGHQPLYNAPGTPGALNGKGTVHFFSGKSPETSSALVTEKGIGLAGNAPRTVIGVMRRTGGLMSAGYGDSGVDVAYFGLCDAWDGLYLPATMTGDIRVGNRSDGWNILSIVFDGEHAVGYANGALKSVLDSKLSTPDTPLEIGIRTAKSGAKWRQGTSDGDFAELLVYDRALNRAEQRQVEKYLATKWADPKYVPPPDAVQWCDTGLDEISGFLYSRETNRLIVVNKNTSGTTLWLVDPAAGMAGDSVLLRQDRLLSDLQSVGPQEFVYASGDPGNKTLFAARWNDKPATPLIHFPTLEWYTASTNREKIALWGVLSNEPSASLWQYDTKTKQLSQLLAYTKFPTPLAIDVKSGTGSFKIASNINLTVTIFTPPNFDRNKKYPLVLGDTYVPDAIHGHWLQAGMAAGGAFVVFVNRPYWAAEIEKWEPNVRAVYDLLKRDPCIDTDRVYLIGASAETHYMSQCMEKTPGLWKGAIILNPGALPDFSKSPPFQTRPKIFIDCGGEENEETRLAKYQRDALNSGAVVDYAIQPGENHRFMGTAGKTERLKAINHFIFEE